MNEGYLTNLIREKKGNTLPLGFTYSECQYSSITPVTVIKVKWILDRQIITLFELHVAKLSCIFDAKFRQ
jgi:hypothetical protein